MTKLTPPDQTARDRIATDLDTTFLVEAGAGSGKTTCLVTRMVALVREGRAGVRNIAAVTFTRKAAAELRERFQEQLEAEVRAADGDKGGAEILRRSLDAFSEATIGTVHSFCAQLLRERPVEAGLDPEFTELEEADSERLLQRHWLEFVDRSWGLDDADAPVLIEAGVDHAHLLELFTLMGRYRDVPPVTGRRAAPDLSAARRALDELLSLVAPHLPDAEPPPGGTACRRPTARPAGGSGCSTSGRIGS